FAGVNPYDIAKAIYAALPGFTCGNENRKEDKIEVCFIGKILCIDRSAADGFIKKGAYLGGCGQTSSKPGNKQPVSQNNTLGKQNLITASPNPFVNSITLSFKAS